MCFVHYCGKREMGQPIGLETAVTFQIAIAFRQNNWATAEVRQNVSCAAPHGKNAIIFLRIT